MSSTNPHSDGNLALIKYGKDKNNGKDDVTVPPGALSIIWGNDQRYWKNPDSAVAELIQVCWLEVTGSIKLRPEMKGKKYEVGFEVSLTPDAFGWSNSPVYIMGKRGKKPIWTKMNLANNNKGIFKIPETPLVVAPPGDGSDNDKVYFGLYEVWSGRWKGGLKIHKAFVREFSGNSNHKTGSESPNKISS
ncbi:protein PHLOEM PROTEIN 2-LIKE A9-like [Ipomoea triloba]|uniref:protein PHLOEM PROTEIN 2-LIKE A9-like n=1 Tax=Ipomoea triloba TaxID=35885 RepID=UPI00125D9EF0|nr:protein PHLOEM PROTEIN 2-LIKE A9-like [Ipomoea triloba]